jgi:DNA-binding PadR family transcriptional regulator
MRSIHGHSGGRRLRTPHRNQTWLNIGFYIYRIRLMLTYQTALVLEALAAGRHHGWDIMDATDLPSGTVYPILRRIEEEGLVRARWEKESEARREQRPARRYYELTPAGVTRLGNARARFRAMTALGARMQRRWKPA